MGDQLSVSEEKSYTFQDDKKINVSGKDYSLSARYHESEIEQNDIVVKSAVKMIWVGIGLLAIGLIFSVVTDKNWIVLVPGAFVDVFSGAIIHLVNKSSESKQKYFDNLTAVEHEQRILEIIQNNPNEEFQRDMIKKIVEKHCNT